jgi:hypothetical protein
MRIAIRSKSGKIFSQLRVFAAAGEDESASRAVGDIVMGSGRMVYAISPAASSAPFEIAELS